jgi:hypothetical protein
MCFAVSYEIEKWRHSPHFPLIGYSPSGSAKLDPQLAIYLPYFKWDPTSRSISDEYPSLRDYAQPSIFHGTFEHEHKKRSSPHSLPLVVHQLWLFVTGSSNAIQINLSCGIANLKSSRNSCVLSSSSSCPHRRSIRR